ncbi:hypothetical protein GOV14_04370 [Candidatus Pacearchaeota archaeon]|nr:hypothetical protein [Candidatus Pacearchaeota archaeon]
MKIQLAYRYTGEDPDKLKEILKSIIAILEEKGHETYTPILDSDSSSMSKQEIYTDALRKMDDTDILLVYMSSSEKSEGMLVELGYALGKDKKVILCVDKTVDETRVRYFTEDIIEFEDVNDLYDKLKALDI